MASKRSRVTAPTVDDIMYKARFLMENDPFKERAPTEEDQNFRAMFGTGAGIVLILWNLLQFHDVLPNGGTITHLLWMLLYLKTYAKWKTMKKITNVDPKTLRKWIRLFLKSVELLEPFVILWKNRKKGDILNDCLVSVDCVDFPIPHAGRRFYTHKWKFKSALRYEVAVSILHGEVVWVNGPYEPGIYNDIKIFRDALIHQLDPGERVEADDGYIGEAPMHVKCPKSIGKKEITAAMSSHVRSRHETVNKRFKQWNILNACYRGDIKDHASVFRCVALVTQLCIENGFPLFSVEYEDPDWDNYYFDDDATDDEDE